MSKIYCMEKYERCRLRASVHSFVSAALFIYAWSIFVLSLWDKRASISGMISTFEDLHPLIVKQFTYIITLYSLTFFIHFFRTYVSLFVIEKDATFYKDSYIHIDRCFLTRFLEWVVRLLILISLVSFISYGSQQSNETTGLFLSLKKLPFIERFYSGLFQPILTVYVLLIIWDILMVLFIDCKIKYSKDLKAIQPIPKKILFALIWSFIILVRKPFLLFSSRNEFIKGGRAFWFFNDIIGLLGIYFMASLENQSVLITEGNILVFVPLITIAGTVSLVLLIINVLANLTRYLKYFIGELLPLRGIECGDECPA